jgi:hypothetical protein
MRKPTDLASSRFDVVLAGVLPNVESTEDSDSLIGLDRRMATIAPPLENYGGSLGGGEFFEEFFAPVDELEVSETQAPLGEAAPDAIRRELGLDRAFAQADLNRARRTFMWRNHPDRFSEAQRELATKRTSIANSLLDMAAASLEPPKHK